MRPRQLLLVIVIALAAPLLRDDSADGAITVYEEVITVNLDAGQTELTRSDLLTIDEAAKELGVQPSTIRMAIKRKTINAIKIGKRLNAIPLAEVERYRRERLGKHGPMPGTTKRPHTDDD